MLVTSPDATKPLSQQTQVDINHTALGDDEKLTVATHVDTTLAATEAQERSKRDGLVTERHQRSDRNEKIGFLAGAVATVGGMFLNNRLVMAAGAAILAATGLGYLANRGADAGRLETAEELANNPDRVRAYDMVGELPRTIGFYFGQGEDSPGLRGLMDDVRRGVGALFNRQAAQQQTPV